MSKAAIEFDQLPKDVVAYIRELESRLNGDIQTSVIRFRNALKGQIDNICKVLENAVVLDISDSDDKTLDRCLKLSTESKKIIENLIYLEGIIAPKEEEEAVAADGSVESYVKMKKTTVK